MTTFAEHSVVCGACGRGFTHQALSSTNSFGHPDLDTRPAEMQRSTMRAWVQRCPTCGYCSQDVTKFDDRFRAVIDGAAYRSQLADSRYPALASTFVCVAMLADTVGRRADAGWAYLRAAWVLDDAKKDDLSVVCRGMAADRFLALLAEGQSFLDQAGVSEAVTIDCLRRAGRGPEALTIIERASTRGFEDIIQKLLTFQQALIGRGDTRCHGIGEALENK